MEGSKAILRNALNNGSKSVASTGLTRSAISAGLVKITDEAGRKALTGTSVAAAIGGVSRDTATANTTVQEQDYRKLAVEAKLRQEFGNELFKPGTVFTGEAHEALFAVGVDFYMVTCTSTADKCLKDPSLITTARISAEEARKSAKLLRSTVFSTIPNGAPNWRFRMHRW